MALKVARRFRFFCSKFQPLSHHVAAGRRTEHAPILAIELRRTLVAHVESDTGRVPCARQEPPPRFLQPDLLLKLERTHGCHFQKMPMKGRNAHARDSGQLFHSNGLIKPLANHMDRSTDVRQLAGRGRELTNHFAARSEQQTKKNFTLNQRCQCRDVLGFIQEPKQPQNRIEQSICYDWGDRQPHRGSVGAWTGRQIEKKLCQDGSIKRQRQAKVRSLDYVAAYG
jgi:hypothetical protein